MKRSAAKGRQRAGKQKNRRESVPTLKDLARHLDLSPTTVSLVLNRSKVAEAIPRETQERVFEAARHLGYRPNYMARSLRSRRSYSIGVLVPEISDPYASEVVSGIESHLLGAEYHYLVTSHRRSTPKLLEEDLELFSHRGVDGMILVATELHEPPQIPTVVISGHTRLQGLTNVVIDHDRAARDTLDHLVGLGHTEIALFKGQQESSDTEYRARAIMQVAASRGITIRPELTVQLSGDGEVFSPDEIYGEGYTFAQRLMGRGVPFTALIAFDDASAIGAIRAFLDAGLRVPEDVSVVGFDDVQSAAFHNPRLTTVRQPLRDMGATAARVLLERLAGKEPVEDSYIVFEPRLIVRDSTARAREEAKRRRGG